MTLQSFFIRILRIYKSLKFKKQLDFHFFFPSVKPFMPNKENTAIVSVINDNFVDYFIKFSTSIKKYNKDFDYSWYVFYNGNISPLSSESRHKILRFYPNVIFKEVDTDEYLKFKELVPPNLFPSILKLELLKLKQYKKILCLDVDTLCLGSLDFLLTKDFTFAAAQAGSEKRYSDFLANSNKFKRGLPFNAGILVFGEKLIKDKNIFSHLLKYDQFAQTAEQTLYNDYFRFYPVYILPIEYNFFADRLHEHFTDHAVKILHYTGPKPHAQTDIPLADLWLNFKE